MTTYGGYQPTQLDKELDKQIAEVNAAYLADPDAQAEALETGERWAAWIAGELAVKDHAVVLPVALAHDIHAVLSGGPGNLPTDLLARMLADHLTRAEGRANKGART